MKPLPATLRTDMLMLACALAMTGCALAVIFGPSILDHSPTPTQQRQELETRQKEAATVNAQLAAARAALNELTQKIETTPHLQPHGKINDCLLSVTDLAARAAITVSQMTPSSPDAKNRPETGQPRADAVSQVIPIKLSGKGSYPAVTDFLRTMHARLHDVAVIGIHLEAVPDEHEPESTTGSFTIDLAWHAALAGATPPTGTAAKP